MEIKNKIESKIVVNNKNGVIKYLKGLKFPIYFLDFEAVTNTKEWMFKHDLDIKQQLSSFSMLKINTFDDDETKIKHFNFIGKEENYGLMAKKLTDFYTDKGSTVVVWGCDLEIRALAKLMHDSPESMHKKLGSIIANMLDLNQLFYTGSFIKSEPTGKSSLDTIAKTYGIYKASDIQNGKKAHFILQHSLKDGINFSHIANIEKRIKEYNNSDVINIKRILVEIVKGIANE